MLSPALANATKAATQAKESISRVGSTVAQSLRNVKAQAQDAVNKVGMITDRLTGRNKLLKQSYSEIQENIRRLENVARSSKVPSVIREARKELEALQRQANKQMGVSGSGSKGKGGGMFGMLGSVKGVLGTLGIAIGASALISSASGMVSDSIGKSLERQQIQTSFDVLAGNKEKGGALTKQLVALQKDTILGSEVFKNAQTMMGFGFDATEVMPNMKMLGDVSMGDANKLNSLTLAFSQVRAAGKLTGQDLLQFINAGFNPLEVIAGKTGKTIGQLKEQVEKGNISFNMVQDAFKAATSEGGRFENMLGKIAETPAGKMQQLSGAWDEFKINAGNAFMPLVSMALDFASQVLPILENSLGYLTTGVEIVVGWIQTAKSETGGWMDYVNIIKDYYSQHILPLVLKVWNVVSQMVAKLYSFVQSSELLKDIFYGIYKVFGWVSDAVGVLIDGLVWVFDHIVMPILNGLEKAWRWVKGKNETSPDDPNNPEPKPSPVTEKPNPKSPEPGITPSSFSGFGKTDPEKGKGKKYNPSDKIKGVAGGGSKETHINIVLNKDLVGQITINPVTMSQGMDEVVNVVKQYLAQLINSANRIAN
jgi:tape measure domain-containing protein